MPAKSGYALTICLARLPDQLQRPENAVATKLLRETGHLKAVQKALSHRDIKTTTRYAHVCDEEVADAMERPGKKQNQAPKAKKKS